MQLFERLRVCRPKRVKRVKIVALRAEKAHWLSNFCTILRFSLLFIAFLHVNIACGVACAEICVS